MNKEEQKKLIGQLIFQKEFWREKAKDATLENGLLIIKEEIEKNWPAELSPYLYMGAFKGACEGEGDKHLGIMIENMIQEGLKKIVMELEPEIKKLKKENKAVNFKTKLQEKLKEMFNGMIEKLDKLSEERGQNFK